MQRIVVIIGERRRSANTDKSLRTNFYCYLDVELNGSLGLIFILFYSQ